jgi:hypothetical protein
MQDLRIDGLQTANQILVLTNMMSRSINHSNGTFSFCANQVVVYDGVHCKIGWGKKEIFTEFLLENVTEKYHW